VSPDSSYALLSIIPDKLRVGELTPIPVMKAIKNPVEIQGMNIYHRHVLLKLVENSIFEITSDTHMQSCMLVPIGKPSLVPLLTFLRTRFKWCGGTFCLSLSHTHTKHTHTHTHTHTMYDNLIPGMAAACCWVVGSGKLMYTSSFGHVPTCVYVSYRPN
jgi:hypothetical protein